MGLYDGLNGLESIGSTAEIARWLRAPVILVMDVAIVKAYAQDLRGLFKRLTSPREKPSSAHS